jgi:hypothetical protein
MKNSKTTKTYVVRETYMGDGIDLIHEWSTIQEAKESGRFDFLVDNGDITEKAFDRIKTIPALLKAASYPFSLEEIIIHKN